MAHTIWPVSYKIILPAGPNIMCWFKYGKRANRNQTVQIRTGDTDSSVLVDDYMDPNSVDKTYGPISTQGTLTEIFVSLIAHHHKKGSSKKHHHHDNCNIKMYAFKGDEALKAWDAKFPPKSALDSSATSYATDDQKGGEGVGSSGSIDVPTDTNVCTVAVLGDDGANDLDYDDSYVLMKCTGTFVAQSQQQSNPANDPQNHPQK